MQSPSCMDCEASEDMLASSWPRSLSGVPDLGDMISDGGNSPWPKIPSEPPVAVPSPHPHNGPRQDVPDVAAALIRVPSSLETSPNPAPPPNTSQTLMA